MGLTIGGHNFLPPFSSERAPPSRFSPEESPESQNCFRGLSSRSKPAVIISENRRFRVANQSATFELDARSTMAEAKAADAVPPAAEDAPHASTEQNINPWSVSGEVGEDGKVKAIDYKKLTTEFGTSLIDDALLERFERVTGHRPHRFMRRQIVFSHRDLSLILDRFEKVRGF